MYWLYADLLDVGPDPNRDVVAILKPLLQPGDAVLINYEDIPLMFYTDAAIRGGMTGFCVEDHSAPPPRFVVVRGDLVYGVKAFYREIDRQTWRRLECDSSGIGWGNIPDPLWHRARRDAVPARTSSFSKRPRQNKEVARSIGQTASPFRSSIRRPFEGFVV